MNLLWLLPLFLISGVSMGADDAVEHTTAVNAREAWIQMDKDLKSGMNKVLRKAMPALMKEIYKKEISTSCLSSLLQFTTGLKKSRTWAFKLLDSSGRFPEGFLSGTLTSLGNYQECVSISVNETKFKMRGQYCTVELLPPLPEWKPFTPFRDPVPEMRNISSPDSIITFIMNIIHNLHVTSIKVGVCTPSLCTKEDIQKLADIVPEKLGINWKMHVKSCEVKENLRFTDPQVAVLYIMGTILLAVFCGTIVDSCCSFDDMEKITFKYKLLKLLRAFSFTSNARKLSKYTCPQDQLSFVYGIIFIIFYWTIIADTFMYINYDIVSNLLTAFDLIEVIVYEILLNRMTCLQALFFISGLVTTYKWLTSPDDCMKIWKFLLKRYLRYTPTYALVLVLILITPTWGSGPTWNSTMQPIYEKCKSNWWYNLLYINNYIDSGKMCLNHTWVFAVDAQLHVMAVLLLIPLKLRPKIGLFVTLTFLVGSLVSIALTNVYYDLPPNEMLAFLHVKDRNFYAEHSYYRLYSHIPLYCTGVLVAHFMVHYPSFKVPCRWRFAIWIITLSGLLASCCSIHEWRSGELPSPLVASVYATFSKIAASTFLAWLSVACMSGNSTGLRDVLSWRPFVFLAKLFFIAYIMHVPIILMVQGFRKSHMFVSDLQLFYITLNHAAGTLIVSYLLYLCFEAPFISLMGVVCRRVRGRNLSSTCDIRPMTEKPLKEQPTWRPSDKSKC